MWLAAHPADMQVIQSFGDNFAAGLEDAISGAKSFGDAMRDVLKSLATEILDVIIKQEILANLFNLILPGSSGGTAMFGGGAATLGRATGGPVGANIAYTVGENGQETFIPATNGYILPNTATTNSGGSNSQITQNIYVSAGVAASVKQEMYNLLPQFQQSTMNAIVQAKQRGGVFATQLAA
jgi:hypothetical protein